MTAPIQLAPIDLTAQPPEMDKLTALQIWEVLKRNKFLIMGATAAACALAALMVAAAPRVYESSLSLRVEEKSSGLPLLEVLATLSDEGSELNTEMQMLRSRALAEATVDSLGLQVTPLRPTGFLGLQASVGSRPIPRGNVLSLVRVPRGTAPAEYRLKRSANFDYSVFDRESGERLTVLQPGKPGAIRGVTVSLSPLALNYKTIDLNVIAFSDAVAALRRNFRVTRPQRDAQFVQVSFQSTDPDLAAAVPNVLADKFLELRNQIQKTEATSTVRFLRRQIDTLSSELSSTEDALRAFRQGNQVVSLSAEASVQVGELAKLQAERGAKEAEREALTHALHEARARSGGKDADSASAYRSLVAFPTLITTSASQFLQALNDAENQRALLLQRRTRQDRDVQVLTARIRELEQQLSSITETYISGLSSQIASIDAALARFGAQISKIPSKELQLARLERQNKVLVEIFTLLQTRLQEAQIAQAVEDSRVRVVDMALVPAKPIKPNARRYLLLAFVLGVLIGVGIAFARESLDHTVHTLEDMALATRASNLGLIPHIAATDRNGDGGAGLITAVKQNGNRSGGIAAFDPQNPVVEAYRSLRTNITFSRPEDKAVKTLVFTSPTPGDGKTTTTANLASTVAHQGHRVALVDGDMRRGTLHQVFGIQREPGLSNLLIGAADLDQCIQRVHAQGLGSLSVLPCGISPPNPSELIGSSHMTQLLEKLESEYDMIIFDSPPLNLVTDAAILSTKADGVIIVGRAGRTERGAVTYAADLLKKVHARLLGTILNDFNIQRDARYRGYGVYGYYYRGGYGAYSYGNGASNGKETKSVSDRFSLLKRLGGSLTRH